MEHDIPALLRKLLEVVPGKQAGLAKMLGGKTSQSQVSRWLDGGKPSVENYHRIIEAAHDRGVLTDVRSESVAASLEGPMPERVKIKGYVGAGGQAHFYAISQGDLDEVSAPKGSSGDTVAVEIRGDSLGSIFDRWLVFYDEVRRPVTEDLIGKLCVVGLPDDRVLIKKIRKGRGGLYRLVSEREDPIENVQIEWAAEVKSMAQRRS
jgi:hypothetical protein